MLAREPFERRLAALKRARAPYEDDWRLISDYIRPRRTRFFRTSGHERDTRIINGSPKFALRTLGAGMHAGLSSPARPWLRMITDDPGLMEYGPVRDHLAERTAIFFSVLARTNIYRALHTNWINEGQFGTAAMVIEGDDDAVARARVMPIGEYYLAADADGICRTLYRETTMTVGQWIGTVGLENVSAAVRRAYDRSDTEDRIEVCHAIEANDARVPYRADWRGKAFRSAWWEKDSDADKLAKVLGYEECPIIAPRWEVLDLDTYGEGPGHDALNDAIGLQRMEAESHRLVQKLADPPTVMPSSMKGYGNTPAAAGQNFFGDGPPEAARALYQVPHDISPLEAKIAGNVRRIDSAFYRDVFQLIAQAEAYGTPATAREIIERKEEKMVLVGPTVERQHSEGLGPLVRRVDAMIARAGFYREPPPELARANVSIDYLSPLAQAQKMVDASSIERMATFIGNLAGVAPSVVDKLDADQAVDEYARIIGANARIIVSDDKAAKIRSARAQQQAQAQQAQLAAQAIAGAKQMSETSIDGTNLLGRIAGVQ
ncbi:putative tail protein [uncultured Alphaproteobacteria bacterium]|uniref:Putative tail protein n=1 Tax=uncultured Alphaproteobacteria bacterium TaxID=91750 RepID=A0A212KM74_9PROT|nr:putative tail protein [uncultured Alphaproteobacteria bacterium]